MATAQQDILNRYSKVTVIGAGVIGASWTALFLAHGLAVVVNDPRPDVETIVRDYIRNNLPTLNELGLPTDNLEKRLSFEVDLERSVTGADLVILDTDDPALAAQAPETTLDAAIFGPCRRPVRDLMSGGRWVVREGRHAREAEVFARYRTALTRLAR